MANARCSHLFSFIIILFIIFTSSQQQSSEKHLINSTCRTSATQTRPTSIPGTFLPVSERWALPILSLLTDAVVLLEALSTTTTTLSTVTLAGVHLGPCLTEAHVAELILLPLRLRLTRELTHPLHHLTGHTTHRHITHVAVRLHHLSKTVLTTTPPPIRHPELPPLQPLPNLVSVVRITGQTVAVLITTEADTDAEEVAADRADVTDTGRGVAQASSPST